MHNHYVPVFPGKISKKEIFQLNPLVLSFIGDSVQTLYVRTKLGLNIMQKTGALHTLTCKEINAVSQSEAMLKLLPFLTEEELLIYKRGRNSKIGSVPKSATATEYHIASGFEAVLGYLYLLNQSTRLHDLLEKASSDI